MKRKLRSDLKRARDLKDRDIVRDDDAAEVKTTGLSKTVFFPRGVKSGKEIRQAFEEKYGIDMTFFDRPVIEEPQPAQTISLRIPIDLLDWWKNQGKGYQTRIIALMRAYMLHQMKKTKVA